jgi:hypothetical protein
MAAITDATLIYDSTAQRLYTKAELASLLTRNLDATTADLHVNIRWRDGVTECHSETHGLRKIGLDELRTVSMEHDEKILVTEVLQLAVERLWNMASLPREVEVEAYEDTFRLLVAVPSDGFAQTRILRMQTA